MVGTNGLGASPGIALHPWYGLLTLAYVGAVSWLSSVPDLGVRGDDALVQLASNLLHIPLFAGLTFCFVQTISGGRARQELTWHLLGLTMLGIGIYAALDEWHQSFVPGRYGTLQDVFLDFAGIVGTLLILRLRGTREADT